MEWGFGAPYPVAARCHAPWSPWRAVGDGTSGCDGKVVPPEKRTTVSIVKLVERAEITLGFMTVYDVYDVYGKCIELVHFGLQITSQIWGRTWHIYKDIIEKPTRSTPESYMCFVVG